MYDFSFYQASMGANSTSSQKSYGSQVMKIHPKTTLVGVPFCHLQMNMAV
jgi:hypothetical protein